MEIVLRGLSFWPVKHSQHHQYSSDFSGRGAVGQSMRPAIDGKVPNRLRVGGWGSRVQSA